MSINDSLFHVNTALSRDKFIAGIEDRIEKIIGIADCISVSCIEAYPNNTGNESIYNALLTITDLAKEARSLLHTTNEN